MAVALWLAVLRAAWIADWSRPLTVTRCVGSGFAIGVASSSWTKSTVMSAPVVLRTESVAPAGTVADRTAFALVVDVPRPGARVLR